MTRAKKYLIVWLPPVLALCFALVCVLDFDLVRWAAGVYKCPLHAVTGFLCPGCGGTRSMMAMLHGDFLLAVHENPVAPVLALLAVLLYIERCCGCFGREVHLIPRSMRFWSVPLTVMLVWALVRNFVPALMPYT